jgi:hypothetical protein
MSVAGSFRCDFVGGDPGQRERFITFKDIVERRQDFPLAFLLVLEMPAHHRSKLVDS